MLILSSVVVKTNSSNTGILTGIINICRLIHS